jgi:signal transduction histidine kinase/ActR/RegA family two-component response regulator
MFLWQYHPDAPWFLVAAGTSTLLAAFSWRRREMPTAPAFTVMMLGQSAWALGSGLELLVADVPAKIFCLDLMNIGVIVTPPSLLVFVLRYTSRASRLSRRRLAMIFAPAAVMLLVTWTNPWHHLYYRAILLVRFHGAWTGFEPRGPLFWVNAAYLYSAMALASLLLVMAARRSSGTQLARLRVLIVGVLLPWFVNALDLSGRSPIPQLDLTSMVFTATGLLLVPGVLHLKMLDLVPVARDRVLQGMREAVIVLDPQGRIAELNRAAHRLLDRNGRVAFGEAATLMFRSWGELVAQLEDLSERSVEIGGADDSVSELQITRLEDAGRLAGWLLLLRDITERRRAEQERQHRAGIEAESRAKDHFLAVLSHELRTPLTPILAAVSAMLEDDQDPAVRTTLEMIRRNVELEARLIDDLLDLTRIGRGDLRLDLQSVDAHEVVLQAVDVCRGLIEQGRISLELDLLATDHYVEADPARLQQVTWNLLQNAAKFTPPGGSIAVRARNWKGPDNRSWLVVEVIDTGVGIATELLPRIFEAFEQGGSTPRHRRGLGLGLAIGRSLAEAQGGRLTATSAGQGQGSTFSLELPTVAQPAVALPPEGPSEFQQGSSRRLRILLVEDNRDSLRYLALVLQTRGHEVTPVARLSQALEAVDVGKFDLVISDIELPDGSGLDLMRRVQGRGLPGIALSGYGAEEDVWASLGAGFAEHLTKPVDAARLEAAIRRAVSASQRGAGV